jgi:hypothetical protein
MLGHALIVASWTRRKLTEKNTGPQIRCFKKVDATNEAVQ